MTDQEAEKRFRDAAAGMTKDGTFVVQLDPDEAQRILARFMDCGDTVRAYGILRGPATARMTAATKASSASAPDVVSLEGTVVALSIGATDLETEI